MSTTKIFIGNDLLSELDQLEDYVKWSSEFMKVEEFEPAEEAMAKMIAFIRRVPKAETLCILESTEYALDVSAILYKYWGVDIDLRRSTSR